VSEDGKGIVMRSTKRAAERESRKLKTRLSQGEKRNRERMATVAAVYSIERQGAHAQIHHERGRPEEGRGAQGASAWLTGIWDVYIRAVAFILDAGICSSLQIARFWGLGQPPGGGNGNGTVDRAKLLERLDDVQQAVDGLRNLIQELP